MANNSSNVFNIINKTKQFVYHSVFFEKKSEFVSMQKTNKMSSAVKVLLSLMFLYIVVYAFLTPCFDSGDDFVMQSIASGTYTGTPDEHLVFINVILGFFLKFLYTNTQFINWYIVVLVGLQFISLYVIFLYLKLKNVNFFIVVTSLFIAIYFIQNIQFTTISGLLCLAGMLVLNASLNHCNIKFLIVSFFFLFLSSLLRLEMALLVGLFCVIFMLIEHKEKIVTMIRTKKMIVFVV
ncbi:MAG TPA: hypothetical protein DDZ41_02685, partial [Flavobacterium sp.]|nr:hypothetical protein [Flavobacterium sp.]